MSRQETLTIDNVGPIRHAEIDVRRFMTFIGPQASGKSTVARLLWFYRELPLKLVELVQERVRSVRAAQPGSPVLDTHLAQQAARKWYLGCMGRVATRHAGSTYHYPSGVEVIVDAADGQVDPGSMAALAANLRDIVERGRQLHWTIKVPAIAVGLEGQQRDRELEEWRGSLVAAVLGFFGVGGEGTLFIPAGRAAISGFLGQLPEQAMAAMDGPTRELVRVVNRCRPFAMAGIDAMAGDGEQARELAGDAQRILKGGYVETESGGELVLPDGSRLPVGAASSGQQEVLWILLLLVLLAHDDQPLRITVEEPEAHLYPDAQRAVVEFIVRAANATGSSVLLTTHSPYILTALSNLIYAGALARNSEVGDAVRGVVDEGVALDEDEVSAYWFGDGTAVPVVDRETHAIDSTPLHGASASMNEVFDQLLGLDPAVPK